MLKEILFGKIIIISLILIIGIIYLVYGSLDYKSVKIILILGAGLFLWSQRKKGLISVVYIV